MRGPLQASATELSSPKVRHCHDRAWSPPRADDPDRPRLLHDDPIALNISAPHRVAARLVVGPDDVWDVGGGNERYNAVAPSGSGSVRKSMVVTPNPPQARGFVSGRASPGPLRDRAETERLYVAHSARQRLTKPSDQLSRARSSRA